MINVHLPGCGITPFNVYDLSYIWWSIYRARAREAVDAISEARRRARNGQ